MRNIIDRAGDMNSHLIDIYPKIIESHSEYGVNIGKIVKRIIRYAPKTSIQGLKIIRILDKAPNSKGFACYLKEEREIRLFVNDLIGWQPWLLKKSFIFPYLSVGLALGHEIDHHVNRNNETIDREIYAERNALKYVYPSLGVFKPLAKLFSFLFKRQRPS